MSLKSRFAYYLGDIIYGANDGIITTFAVVSSAAGAGFPVSIIIILGIANLIADGFSMGASSYLSQTSEQSLEDAKEKGRSPVADGVITFISFVIIGSFPLLPFVFISTSDNVFLISTSATAVTLFIVGAARALVTTRGALISGIEMLVVGGVAAAIAYGLGAFIKAIVGATI